MATATVSKIEIITLTLTKYEAEALLRVCNRVGGSRTLSRRGAMDNILYALENVGVHDIGGDFLSGELEFLDQDRGEVSNG